MADQENRKRVMQRSMRLGHCICNPSVPCPCPTFRRYDVCTCAGERLEAPSGPVRLTKLVDRPGCASKVDRGTLHRVISCLPAVSDPNVIVGIPAGDDAGVYQVPGGPTIVQTVDVFTPCVDDPRLFGQIAAANSVSDIYAMGARPITALSIVGVPVDQVPEDVLSEILAGGVEKMNEAGCAVIGGHTINDPQIKAGFAVTGLVDRDGIITNAGARPGDVLILTKPIGTGIIAFASQIDRVQQTDMQAAIRSMTSLNRTAAQVMLRFGVHACTDVTGFGLLGHLSQLASASGVDIELVWDHIPMLPGVLEYAAAGILPGGIERNRKSFWHKVICCALLPQEMVDICYDPQTSGGLVICVEPMKADRLLSALHEHGVMDCAIIGKVLGTGKGLIRVITDQTRAIPPIPDRSAAKTGPVVQDQSCCQEHPSVQDQAGDIKARYMDFLAAVNRPGGLDAFTKQAIAIALSVALRCKPCLKMHLEKARNKGFTEKEIDEAAWMGISFAGSPAMAFYQHIKSGK